MVVQVCEEFSVLPEAFLDPGALFVLEHLQLVSGGRRVELAHVDPGTGKD